MIEFARGSKVFVAALNIIYAFIHAKCYTKK